MIKMIRNLLKRTNICSENKDIIYLTREEYKKYVYKLTKESFLKSGHLLWIEKGNKEMNKKMNKEDLKQEIISTSYYLTEALLDENIEDIDFLRVKLNNLTEVYKNELMK